MANHEAHGIKLFGATITLHGGGRDDQKIDAKDSPTDHPTATAEKRPDKIIPCPRCKSMETKFCYFNNYNVNQPRHFCKGCQRYWTAGGALRNVPVGAGRRRTKPPTARAGFAAMYGPDEVHQVDLDRLIMAEEWQQALAAHGGLFRHAFQVKRPRSTSAADIGRSC